MTSASRSVWEPPAEGAQFRHQYVVSKRDIDQLGHASNISYLRWIQDAAMAHSQEVGLGHADYLAIGAVFVVRRHEVDYLRPALAGQTLEVRTWVDGWSAATSLRRTVVSRVEDGVELARAATTWAFVTSDGGRPTRIPAAVRDAFAGDPAPPPRKKKASMAASKASMAASKSGTAVGGDPRPFLKWAGGKRGLLPQILPFVPSRFRRYHEPFVGSGALFFYLAPEHASLSDNNDRLVRTYRGLRDDPDGVIALLETYPHDKDFFYRMRRRNIDAASDVEVAAWFIYLNKTGYNGLYRVNSKNSFNVPFGDYKRPKICNAALLRRCSRLLAAAELEVRPFDDAAAKAKRGDFVYFDPPYVPLSPTSSFTNYTDRGFGLAEHERLRDVAARLKRRGVQVLISNSAAPEVRQLYAKGFELIEISARRSINSKGSGRGAITELLIR